MSFFFSLYEMVCHDTQPNELCCLQSVMLKRGATERHVRNVLQHLPLSKPVLKTAKEKM